MTSKKKPFENISNQYFFNIPHFFPPSPKQLNSTLTQTTNFRLFENERDCRGQLKFDVNGRKFLKWVESTVGKGEIARNDQFYPFPSVFVTCTADM